jgi:hypothetical protein
MSELSHKMVAGIEGIGAMSVTFMLLTVEDRTLPDAVRKRMTDIAMDLAQRTDELRTLAKEIP